MSTSPTGGGISTSDRDSSGASQEHPNSDEAGGSSDAGRSLAGAPTAEPSFDPFPFGAPPPGSPVASAFPELFGPPAGAESTFAQNTAGAPSAAGGASAYFAPPTYPPYTGAQHSPEPGQPSPQQPSPQHQHDPPQRPGEYGWQPHPGQYPGQYGGQSGTNQYGQPPGPPPGWAASGWTPQGGYPSTASSNGKAVAGLILGIVSLALFIFTILDIPVVVLGIVFSVLGLRAAKRGEGRRGMALAGLICSVVAALVVTVTLTYVVHRMKVCDERYDRGTSSYNSCLVELH